MNSKKKTTIGNQHENDNYDDNVRNNETIQESKELYHNINLKLNKLAFKSKNQELLWDVIDNNFITLIGGEAGTGKSYMSVAKALTLLTKEGSKYKQIILTTPIVEADEKLGAIPGTIDQKTDPYTFSMYYIFEKLIGKRRVDKLKERNVIKVVPLAYMRGVTFSDCIIVFDEMQNATPRQVKTALTRIGDNCKFICTGDMKQSDKYKNAMESGLYVAMNKLTNIKGLGVFNFEKGDIVRHPIISKILEKFDE